MSNKEIKVTGNETLPLYGLRSRYLVNLNEFVTLLKKYGLDSEDITTGAINLRIDDLESRLTALDLEVEQLENIVAQLILVDEQHEIWFDQVGKSLTAIKAEQNKQRLEIDKCIKDIQKNTLDIAELKNKQF